MAKRNITPHGAEALRVNVSKALVAAKAKRASGGTPLLDLYSLPPRQRGAAIVNAGLTPEDRFWLQVKRSSRCWEWLGRRTHKGYGEISIEGAWKKAHRFAWEITNGPIARGMQICHTCDNRACVRPDHLFVGTNSDNQRDAVKKGRGPAAKLSPEDVRLIRGLLELRVGVREIASRFGVSPSPIWRIKHRKAYSYVE